MWKRSEQSISSGDDSINLAAGRDVNAFIFLNENVPTGLVDQKTEEEVEKLRKSRFFLEFDTIGSTLRFGSRIAEGELSGGTAEVRERGLA